MDKLVRIACDLLDVAPSDVLSSRVYDDRVAFVVRQGHKYVLPRDELATPEPVEINATTEARAIAKRDGIDLSAVTGTGKGGRIIVRDVRKVSDANATV